MTRCLPNSMFVFCPTPLACSLPYSTSISLLICSSGSLALCVWISCTMCLDLLHCVPGSLALCAWISCIVCLDLLHCVPGSLASCAWVSCIVCLGLMHCAWISCIVCLDSGPCSTPMAACGASWAMMRAPMTNVAEWRRLPPPSPTSTPRARVGRGGGQAWPCC